MINYKYNWGDNMNQDNNNSSNQNSFVNNNLNPNSTPIDVSMGMNQNMNISTGGTQVPNIEQNTNTIGNTEYGKEPMINCTKCGEPMKLSSRCCMHCGELNYLNHKNDSAKSSFDLGKKLKLKEEKRAAKKAAKAAKSKNKNAQSDFEKRAKRYSIFKKIYDIILVILVIICIINYKFIIKSFNEFRAKFYLMQVDKMVGQVIEEIDGKNCFSTSDDGVINYSFAQSDDYFNTWISLYTFDYFKGNIQVTVDEDENYHFIISITDGKYGFKDKKYEELDIDDVKKIGELEDIPSHTIKCE